MNNATKKPFHRVVATALASTMLCAVLPFSVFAADGVSDLLTVDGDALYANGHSLTITAAPNNEDSMLYLGDTLVRDLVIAGDANGTDGYDLSDVTIFGGSQNSIDPSATTASITVTGGNVGAIYAGGEALLSVDAAQTLAEMQAALEAALAEVDLLSDSLSDETEAALAEIFANLEAILAAFEADYTATNATLESMLESLETLTAAIEGEIAPYILAESESYLGEVSAALLSAVEDALLAYVDELEDRLTEKAEDVLIATAIDALVILFATNENMTEEELDEYITAIETLVNSGLIDTISAYTAAQSALEAAEATQSDALAAYTAASDAVTAYKATATDVPTTAQYDAPVKYSDAYAAVLADLDENDVIIAYNSANYSYGFGTVGVSNIFSFNHLEIANIIAYMQGDSSLSYSDLYNGSNSSWSWAASGAMGVLIAQITANIVTEVSAMNTVTDADYDAAYAEWAAVEEEWAQYALDNAEYTAALAPLEAAQAAAKADYDTATSAYNVASATATSASAAFSTLLISNYSNIASVLELLGVSISLTDLIAGNVDLDDIVANITDSLTLIYFIADVATLLTGDLEDIDDVTSIISSIYELMETYGLNETFEAILSAALENLTDEFNEEYIVYELNALHDTMVGALEAFANNLGTEGYPNDLETQLEEMLEEVCNMLAATGTDQAVLDALQALLAELANTEGVLEAIIADIFAEISENMLLAELTVEDIKAIIVDVLMEQLAIIMGVELVMLSEATITVTDGTVGTIYASGAGAGYLVSGVSISVSGGTIGEIVNDMPTTADAAAAYLAETLPIAICTAISDAVDAALADFVAPVIVLTGGDYISAPDAAYIHAGYTLVDNEDGTFTIQNDTLDAADATLGALDTALGDNTSPEDLLADLNNPETETVLTAEQTSAIITATETLASLDKETLASDAATVETLNTLDALFRAAVNADGDSGTLNVTATIKEDVVIADSDKLGNVAVEGLAAAVYGSESAALPGTNVEVTLSLEVAQQEVDKDALEDLDEDTLATVFAFSAKPYSTTTTTVGTDVSVADPVLIANEALATPITFTVYLPSSFPSNANSATVLHYFSEDSNRFGEYETLTCNVMTDTNGRYIKITVTEFSDFNVIPVITAADSGNTGSGSTGNNGSTGNTGSNSSNTGNTVVTDGIVVDTTTGTTTNTSTTTTTSTTTNTPDTEDAADTTVTTTPATDATSPADDTTPDANIEAEDALIAVPSTSIGAPSLMLGMLAALVLAGALVFIVVKRRSEQAED